MSRAIRRGQCDVTGHAEVRERASARERSEGALAHVDERPDDADLVFTGRKEIGLLYLSVDPAIKHLDE